MPAWNTPLRCSSAWVKTVLFSSRISIRRRRISVRPGLAFRLRHGGIMVGSASNRPAPSRRIRTTGRADKTIGDFRLGKKLQVLAADLDRLLIKAGVLVGQLLFRSDVPGRSALPVDAGVLPIADHRGDGEIHREMIGYWREQSGKFTSQRAEHPIPGNRTPDRRQTNRAHG